jgi:hypothetical protein
MPIDALDALAASNRVAVLIPLNYANPMPVGLADMRRESPATKTGAESRVLAQCAQIQRASDCLLLASGPDCVAIAWDGDQPINHAHGASGGGRQVVVQAAIASAGPYANDPQSRCSWDPHD